MVWTDTHAVSCHKLLLRIYTPAPATITIFHPTINKFRIETSLDPLAVYKQKRENDCDLCSYDPQQEKQLHDLGGERYDAAICSKLRKYLVHECRASPSGDAGLGICNYLCVVQVEVLVHSKEHFLLCILEGWLASALHAKTVKFERRAI